MFDRLIMYPFFLCTFLGASLLTLGCGYGNGSFTGDIGGREFRPVGSIFGFVDALEPAPELKGRSQPRVVVALTYVAFDPSVDQEHLSGTELADLAHAIEINDWASLWWQDRDKVTKGSSFTDTLVMGSTDGRYDDSDATTEEGDQAFQARFGVARETLEPSSNYSSYQPFGTRAVVTVHLKEVNLESGGKVAGQLTLTVERVESDPADARTGTVEGEFSATMIGERIAEKNFETLDLYRILGVNR